MQNEERTQTEWWAYALAALMIAPPFVLHFYAEYVRRRRTDLPDEERLRRVRLLMAFFPLTLIPGLPVYLMIPIIFWYMDFQTAFIYSGVDATMSSLFMMIPIGLFGVLPYAFMKLSFATAQFDFPYNGTKEWKWFRITSLLFFFPYCFAYIFTYIEWWIKMLGLVRTGRISGFPPNQFYFVAPPTEPLMTMIPVSIGAGLGIITMALTLTAVIHFTDYTHAKDENA